MTVCKVINAFMLWKMIFKLYITLHSHIQDGQILSLKSHIWLQCSEKYGLGRPQLFAL